MSKNVSLILQTPRENVVMAIHDARKECDKQKRKEKETYVLQKQARDNEISLRYAEAMEKIFRESFFHLADKYFKLDKQILLFPHKELNELKQLIKRKARWRVSINSILTLLVPVPLPGFLCIVSVLFDPVYDFEFFSWERWFLRSSSFIENKNSKKYAIEYLAKKRIPYYELRSFLVNVASFAGKLRPAD